MPVCSHCHQMVKASTVRCPHCGVSLKAYGHPGIPLYRAEADAFLCQSCTYHADNTCTFPQRPYAKECTLYQDINQPTPPSYPQRSQLSLDRLWFQRNAGWLIIGGLLGISLLIALI
ncbi:MAG: zinc ribbon domain-containing protein [Pseudanabaenales cyanobacterium]|nr:zinc ribbon domain-containing protein [Pseudanabaenales cyanobacterium]